MDYFVPLTLEEGQYMIEPEEGDPNASGEGYLHIARTEYSFLEYRHPEFGDAIRVYEAPEDLTMIAAYGKDGALSQVSFKVSGSELPRLVYLKKPFWMGFISLTEFKMRRQILRETGEVSRLFFDSFYDGDAVDFYALAGTPEDMEAIRAHYGADTGAVNNSGDYPSEKQIRCDTEQFRIMLFCTPPEQRVQMYRDTVRQIIGGITGNALPKLNKTMDFRLIAGEYD